MARMGIRMVAKCNALFTITCRTAAGAGTNWPTAKALIVFSIFESRSFDHSADLTHFAGLKNFVESSTSSPGILA